MDIELIKLLLQAGSTGVLLVVLYGIFILARAALKKDGVIAALNTTLRDLHTTVSEVKGDLAHGIRVAEALKEDHADMRQQFSELKGKWRLGSDPAIKKPEGR